MSDEGEKTCPLCAEEMDLTDQQLKPCKCGYEICVWCWHHIMEMAEKDEAEGRCPACRTPYDKERIVGTTANCERVVAEVNMEKKYKSQKAKIKTSESRKQLSTVRVIQRNLVYIVGLPLELSDEDLLQRRDYFGQYGKVLKVSISRTSAGTIQQFANNTCSVYITYGNEEEAVRCIQSVHGFILDGRPLRACFGTTKYCHAWLRNVPCSNPDCLYLHEIGSQEDSFTKDEIISAYTRSRVQQITGFTNNMQRRSGNMLPPPSDDYCDSSSAVTEKAVPKHPPNNPASNTRCSPPTSSSNRPGALPAAASWGARASSCSQPAASMVCTNGPTKQKADLISPSLAFPIASSGSTHASVLPIDVGKKLILNEETHARQSKHKLEMLDSSKQHDGVNSQQSISEVSNSLGPSAMTSISEPSCLPAAADNKPGEGTLDSELCVDGQPSVDTDKTESSINDGNIKNLCSGISSVTINNRLIGEHSEITRPNGLCLDNFLSPGSQGLLQLNPEKNQLCPVSAAVSTAVGSFDVVSASSEVCDWRSNSKPLGIQNLTYETEDDFDSQRLRDAVVVSHMPTSTPLHHLGHLRGSTQQHPVATFSYTSNSPIVHRVHNEGSAAIASAPSNGFIENFVSHASGRGNSCSLVNGEQSNRIMGRFDVGLANSDSQPALDMGESSIISNILDLDSWDDSLTSPQNLAKLLGDSEKQEAPLTYVNSWKGQISNQSRFSFARQEEPRNHLFDFESSISNTVQAANNHSFNQAFGDNQDPFLDRLSSSFGYPQHNIQPSENLISGRFGFPSSKLSSSASRSQISAPPGFSAPNRPPPPGFSSHERSDQTYDVKSGNHFMETSSYLRNPYEASPSGNMNSVSDVEFIDPAILAVGKGRLPSGITNSGIDMRPNFHVQTPAFENESRLQLLLQRSLSPHQTFRYSDVKDNYSAPNDMYGFSTRHMEQSQSSNISAFPQYSLQQVRNNILTNGHWDGWSEMQSPNDMGMAELLRGDGLGFNKFRMTNSGDLYNRSYRM